MLCSHAPVGSVPSLSLEPLFRRSHGSLYKALARGAMRIPPGADTTTATIVQVRDLVGVLAADGPVPMFVFDAGYDPIALGHGLADTQVQVLVRIRNDRVFYADPPARPQPSARNRWTSASPRAALQALRPQDHPEPDAEIITQDPSGSRATPCGTRSARRCGCRGRHRPGVARQAG